MKEFILLALLNAADLVSTKLGLKLGMYEINPLGRSPYMVIIKIIGVASVIWLMAYLYRGAPHRIKFLKKITYSLCIITAIAVINNTILIFILM